MVAAAPRIGAVLPAFLEFARGAVLVAHNAPFDLGFLKAACAENGTGLAARGVGRHRRPGPAAAAPATRCPTASWPRSPRSSRPRPRPPTARSTTPARPSTSCTACSSGSARWASRRWRSSPGSPGRSTPSGCASGTWPTPSRAARASTSSAARADEPLYVGTSNDLRSRVRSYFSAGEQRSRITEMVALSQRVDAIPCAHDLEAAVRELRLIAEHKPRYNRRSRFPERALWVRLTEEPFPRLSVVRRVRPGAGRLPRPVPRPARGRRRRRRRARVAAAAAVHRPALPARARHRVRAGRHGPLRRALHRRAVGRRVRLDRGGVPRGRRPPTRAASSRRCSTGSTGSRPRSGTRTPRCSATGSRSCVRAVRRRQRLESLAAVPELVLARPDGAGGWQLSVVRRGRLVAAGVRTAGAPRCARPWPGC